MVGEKEATTPTAPPSTENNSSNELSAGVQQTASVDSKPPKKKVDKFYKRQSELLEYFKTDNEQIQKTRVSRSSRYDKVSALDDLEARNCDSRGSGEVRVQGFAVTFSPVAFESRESASSGADLGGANSSTTLKRPKGMTAAARFATITLGVNISLMFIKALASWLSGSLSIISSLVDSVVDITSGTVIYVTSRAINARDPYRYPRGRTRLEPLALIIVSVVMGVFSVQLITKSISTIADDIKHRPTNCSALFPQTDIKRNGNFCTAIEELIAPRVDAISIAIMIATVVVKFTLVIICKRFKDDPSITVLAMDHRNDCVSNLVALACAWLATKFWAYLDPIGAILVSVYIAYTWCRTGMEHVVILSGRSADPDFINRITKVCLDHDPRIRYIDTVYAYHIGMKYLVEVDIVLDENMPLRTAHDISESLQINIESLPEVERAFVHTDYDFDHMPHEEHKIV